MSMSDVDGLSFQRKDPSCGLHYSSPREPVSMVLPGVNTSQVKKKRKRPGNTSRNKLRRLGYNHWIRKNIKTLGDNLCSIPFSPNKSIDLEAHNCLLTNLGLWDFLNLDFRQDFVPGLIKEIIANYNPKRPIERASFFKGFPIQVSHSVMASALRLPTKTKLPDQSMVCRGPDLDLVVSEEEALFVEDLILTYMVLQGPDDHIPDEVMRVIELVRNRELEQVDWAHLVWCMMEKELLKGIELRDCYYASHMQYLVQYHYPTLFDNRDDDDTGWLEMGSVAGNKGQVKENQLVLLVGNETDDLHNGLFLENTSVERMEVAQLTSEVRVQVVEGENHTVNEDEICNVHTEQVLEEGNRLNDFVTRLFDKVEDKEYKVTVNKGACDADSEYQQKEDDGMDIQTDNFSWHKMDDIIDPQCVETSCQQVGFIITKNKESTESISDVVADDNVLTQVPSIDHISGEHGGEQISVPVDDATDMEQERTDIMLGCAEKHVEESRQQLVCDVCDSDVSTPLEKKEVSMMAANDADQHSSETTNQQSVLGGEDPVSDVLIPGNTVSSTEHLCVSDISVAMELKDKDMLPKSCQQSILLDVLIAGNNATISDQVCVSDKDDVSGTIVDNISKTIADNVSETIVDNISNTIVDSMSKTIADSISNTIVDSMSKTIADSISNTIVDSMSKTIADNVSNQIAENFDKVSKMIEDQGKTVARQLTVISKYIAGPFSCPRPGFVGSASPGSFGGANPFGGANTFSPGSLGGTNAFRARGAAQGSFSSQQALTSRNAGTRETAQNPTKDAFNDSVLVDSEDVPYEGGSDAKGTRHPSDVPETRRSQRRTVFPRCLDG